MAPGAVTGAAAVHHSYRCGRASAGTGRILQRDRSAELTAFSVLRSSSLHILFGVFSHCSSPEGACGMALPLAVLQPQWAAASWWQAQDSPVQCGRNTAMSLFTLRHIPLTGLKFMMVFISFKTLFFFFFFPVCILFYNKSTPDASSLHAACNCFHAAQEADHSFCPAVWHRAFAKSIQTLPFGSISD